MKKFLLGALACALTLPALAASPWDGTWKLDPAKSNFTGGTFTVTKTASGMWHFTDGTVSYDYAPDGKPYSVLTPENTFTYKLADDHTGDFVNMVKGKVTSKMHETLSADGKTLTDETTSYRPDGTTATSKSVSTRIGTGTGFLGTWKSTEVKMSAPDVYSISTPAPGMIKWDIPAYKETVEGKIGGPLPITGPTVPDGLTLTLTPVGDKELKYVVKMKEKTLAEGHMTLSADGKTFTDVSWTPAKPAEKTTGFYVKQ